MLVLWLALVAAPAPPPTAALVIERVSTACEASAEALAAEVAAHLGGRDPFDPAATRTAHVRWWRSGARFVADLALVEADGRRGERRLEDLRCPELVSSVALALAIAIDPLTALRAPGPAPGASRADRRAHEDEHRSDRRAPAPTPPAPAPAAPPTATAPPSTSSFTGGFTLGAVLGAAPAPALGPGVRIELGSAWRVALEAGIGLAGPAAIDRTRVAVVRLDARLEGCRVDGLVVCAGLAYTRWRATAEEGLARPVDAARDSLALAATIGVIVSSARLEAGLAVPLTPPARLVLDGRTAFTAWPLMPLVRLVVLP